MSDKKPIMLTEERLRIWEQGSAAVPGLLKRVAVLEEALRAYEQEDEHIDDVPGVAASCGGEACLKCRAIALLTKTGGR